MHENIDHLLVGAWWGHFKFARLVYILFSIIAIETCVSEFAMSQQPLQISTFLVQQVILQFYDYSQLSI